MKQTQLMGSALLITGTAVGAGMLGIPMATANLGFIPAAFLLVVVWGFSFLAGLLMLEVTLNLQGTDNLHLNAMAKITLGRKGQVTAWICMIGLLYALTVAYISGGESMLTTLLAMFDVHVPKPLLATLFTVALGASIFISTRAADFANRIFLTIKALLILSLLVLCLPVVRLEQIFSTPSAGPHYWLAAAPVVFVSFGFHHVIPSLAQYNHNDLIALRRAIFIGSFTPLVVYLLWLLITLGVLPRTGSSSFETIGGENVGAFISTFSHSLQKPMLTGILNVFANIAIITSFLGVTLGLFDFLRDSFKVGHKDYSKRFGVALLTYGLPLLAAICYPGSFIQLLTYAGVFLAILAFVLPALMALRLRHLHQAKYYQVRGGRVLPIAVMVFGGVLAVLGLMY